VDFYLHALFFLAGLFSSNNFFLVFFHLSDSHNLPYRHISDHTQIYKYSTIFDPYVCVWTNFLIISLICHQLSVLNIFSTIQCVVYIIMEYNFEYPKSHNKFGGDELLTVNLFLSKLDGDNYCQVLHMLSLIFI